MIKIADKVISENSKAFIIAEMSGNHKKDIGLAYDIIKSAAEAGADAIKLQTYTPDTITLNSNKESFMTDNKGLWAGRTLYNLYDEAFTPWEWHKELKEYAEGVGLVFFSSPFDISAVDFLAELEVPCYKIASFEINDIPLIKRAAAHKKPMLMSTGVATLQEIEDAIAACRECGNNDIILLKCTSAYPASIEEANLNMIPDMIDRFKVIVGLSDHTEGSIVPITAIALGAKVIEKHLTLSKKNGAVDSKFSMEKDEFKAMVKAVREAELALGKISYEYTDKQKERFIYKRSLFSSRMIKKGDKFTSDNIKSVRPSLGLSPKYYEEILGKHAACDIDFATPLSWDMIEK